MLAMVSAPGGNATGWMENWRRTGHSVRSSGFSRYVPRVSFEVVRTIERLLPPTFARAPSILKVVLACGVKLPHIPRTLSRSKESSKSRAGPHGLAASSVPPVPAPESVDASDAAGRLVVPNDEHATRAGKPRAAMIPRTLRV